MSEGTIAFFGLIGAAIGAIPGVLGVVIPWLRNRDKNSQAMRELDLAKKEVEFISAWLEAASSIADEEDRKAIQREARARLDSLMSANKATSESLIATQAVEAQEKPRRKGSMALLMYLGFFLFMMFGASIDEQNNSSIEKLLSELAAETEVFVLFTLPLVFLLWRWHRSGRVAA